MATTDHPGLVIAGGGLAGSLLALALVARRPDVPLLLIEGGDRFGGDHLWSWFDSDVEPAHRWLLEPITPHHWDGHIVAFPGHSRRLKGGYNTVRSDALDARVREVLQPSDYLLNERVVEVRPDRVTLEGGRRIKAKGVIDARGAANLGHLDLGWQKFVGREMRFDKLHGVNAPVIMDATVSQRDGYRFVYLLPFDEHRMLIEDTYYVESPELDTPGIGARIEDYARRRGFGEGEVLREETGVLPVAMGGDFGAFWRVGGARVGKIGLRGGLFHPMTGYTLPDAVRTAHLIAAEPDLSGANLHDVLEKYSGRLWKERSFYRQLASMLFRAAEPPERYKVLERFYRLDAGLIGRFYAGHSKLTDKMRILSGKPPVPVGRAMGALKAAS